MAYLLRADAVNDYVQLSQNIVIPSSTPFELSFETKSNDTSGAGQRPFGRIGSFNSRMFIPNGTNTTIEVRGEQGTLASFATYGGFTALDRHTYKITRDVNNVLKLFIDNDEVLTAQRVLSDSFSIGILLTQNSATQTKNSVDFYKFSVLINGVLVRNYDPSASNGTGTTLIDTVGGINGTLVNFPTNNSQWVFYDDGGIVPISFNGTIPNLNINVGDVVNFDLNAFFDGTETPFIITSIGADLSAIGLSIVAGVIVGTATAGNLTGVRVRGTDDAGNTADSNLFGITVEAVLAEGELLESNLSSNSFASINLNNRDAFTANLNSISSINSNLFTPVYLFSGLINQSSLNANLKVFDNFAITMQSESNVLVNLKTPVSLLSNLNSTTNIFGSLSSSDKFVIAMSSQSNLIADLTLNEGKYSAELISTSSLVSNLTLSASLSSNLFSLSNLFGEINQEPITIEVTGVPTINVYEQHAVVEALDDKPQVIVNLGTRGVQGLSAYQIALLNGFVGTELDWLDSLKGINGINGIGQAGASAYAIAVNNGFIGTQLEWLASLKGERGLRGLRGLNGENGNDGISAYEVAVLNGFVGTESSWLNSLKGKDGKDGKDGIGLKGDKGDVGEVDPEWVNSIDGALAKLAEDLAWLDQLLIQVNLDLELNRQKLAQLDLDLDELNNVTLVRVNQELDQARLDLEANRLALLDLQDTLVQVNLDLAWLAEREAVRNQELGALNVDLADLAITLINVNSELVTLNADIVAIKDVNSNLDLILQEFITDTNTAINDLLLETESIKQDLKLEINKNTLSRKESDKLIFDTLNFATQLKNNQTNLTNALFEVDPATGTIRNLAYAYSDNKFTQASVLIDGVNASVDIQAQRVTSAESRITNAESQLTLQAGQINLRATYTDVNQIVAGAIEAIQPAYSFGFFSNAEGWVAVNGTLAATSGQINLTLGDIQNTQLNYNGFENPVITVNIQRTGGTGWAGNLIVTFSDNSTQTYTNVIEDVSEGNSLIRILNLAGNSSYTGTEANPKIITGMRFVFGTSVSDTFAVRTITIGKPSAVLQELDGLQAQVNDLGIEIDAVNASLTNYVTVARYNSETVTLSNVESVLNGVGSYAAIQATLQQFDANDTLEKANYSALWVDAANANIRQQVQSYKLTDIDPELNQIRGDLTTATSKIDAANGTISNQIVSISGLRNKEKDLAKIAFEAEYLFYQAKKKQLDTDVAVSFAFSEIEATSNATSALAQNVLLLSAQLGTTSGTLSAEVNRLDQAIVNESGARANAINNLSASINGQLVAQSNLIQTVQTSTNNNTNAISALDSRVSNGENFAQAQVTLNSSYNNTLGTLTARAFLGTSVLEAGQTKYTITGLTVDSVERGIRFQGDLFELVNGAGLRRLYWQTATNEWQIDGNVLVSGSIRGDALIANTITGDKIAANAISADKIVANSIGSDKIVANAITGDKISANAIDASKIIANSITGDKIQANTISGDRLLVNTIQNDRLISNSITADKLVALTITGDKIAANAISSDKIIANSIGAREIVARSIDASKIVSQTITGDLIAANTIGADKIVANSIGAREIVSFSIIADKLQANSVTTEKIAAGSVTANSIAANAITAEKIAAGSITADKITAGTITGDKLVVNAEINAPVLRGGTLIVADNSVEYMAIIRAIPFGSANDLVEWFGPRVNGVTWDLASQSPIYGNLTKANAKTYKTRFGDVYFGGTFRAGVLSNSLSNTIVTATPTREMTFGSNGGLIELAVSFSYSDTESNFGGTLTCPIPAPAPPSVTIWLEQLVGGSWLIRAQQTFNGSYDCTAGGGGDPRVQQRGVGGSVTFTDNSRSTANRTYRARASVFNYFSTSNTFQSLSITSSEG